MSMRDLRSDHRGRPSPGRASGKDLLDCGGQAQVGPDARSRFDLGEGQRRAPMSTLGARGDPRAASMTRDANAMVEGKGNSLTRLGWWTRKTTGCGLPRC